MAACGPMTDPLFAAEAELHLALEHPHDLLVRVTVRLDMDAGPDPPPYDPPLVARKNATADLFADLLLKSRRRGWKPRPIRSSRACGLSCCEAAMLGYPC